MPNARPDFVQVQLTTEGIAYAGGAPIRISAPKRSFLFSGSTPQEVELSAEWKNILSQQHTPQGKPLFQLVPPPAPAAPAAAKVIAIATEHPEPVAVAPISTLPKAGTAK